MDLVLQGTNISQAIRGIKLLSLNLWRDGTPHACEGFVTESSAGGRATLLNGAFINPIGGPKVGDELSKAGEAREKWVIVNVNGVEQVSYDCDLARGLADGPAGYAPVAMAVAAFRSYVLLTVDTAVSPAGLRRGHRLKVDWQGPTSGSTFSERGAITVSNLMPNSDYAMTVQEFDADGNPSEVARFRARTTS